MSPSRSTPLLVALILVAAGAIGYFGFLHDSGSEQEDNLAGQGPDVEAQASDPSTDLAEVELPPGDRAPGAAEEARVDVAREAEQAEHEEAEAKRQYVTGRVQLGFDLPADEELYVMSVSGERAAAQLYGDRAIAHGVWDPEAKRPGLHHFAPVDPDGSFRVGLPATASVAHLALTGRYVFSKRTTRVALDDQRGDVVLSGELGSWITGELRAPRTLGEPISLAGVKVEMGFDLTSGFNAMDVGADAYELEDETDAQGAFEFRSVSGAVTHGLFVRHDELAANLSLGIKPAPGEHLELVVRMQAGATLRGRVVDETGGALAGADVSATLRGTLGDVVGELSATKTDEAGNFVLEHVLTGRPLEVHASVEGLRPIEHKLEDKLRDSQVLEGLTLILSRGEVISGRVLYPDGQPAAEATVNVTGDLTKSDLAMMGARMAAMGSSNVETDDEGRFEVGGLEEGPYRLSVSVQNDEGDHPGSWRVRRGDVAGGTSELVLELEGLTPVSGFVTTAGERPVEGFTVHLALQGSGGMMGIGAERLRETFESTEDGSFRKLDVPPGLWDVMVMAPGFARSEKIEVEVPQGGGAPLPVFDLVPAASVSGVVYDSFNEPIAGAKVALEMELADRINNAFTGEAHFSLSDHEGRFVLGDLDPGAHTVAASLAGFAASEPYVVDLASGDVIEGVELTLRVGGTLRGEILDDEGEPAVGRMIIVQRVPSYASQYMNSSDARGEFLFEHLEPGGWQVVATPNFMTGELDVGGGDDMSDLLSKLEMDMVEIVDGEETFVQLGKPPENPVELQGRVTHAGEPVSGAVISLVTDGMQGLSDLKLATTGENGEFAVQLDKSGSYLITVQNSVGTGRQNSIEFKQNVPPDVSFHRVDLELPVAGISGRVLDPAGKPAADCRVTLNVDGGIAYGSFLGGHYTEIVTDAEGNYEIPYLRAGSYTVSAGGATLAGVFGDDSVAGRTVRDGISVAEGQWVTGVDFRLERPGSLIGVVRGLDGRPVSGATVFVRDARGRLLERFSMITTDAGGRFEYHGIAGGDYTVSAKKDGFVSSPTPLVGVKAGERAKVEVQLEGGTVFLVTVIDKDGVEIRPRISVKDDDGNEMSGMLSLDEIMNSIGQSFSSKEQRVGPLPAGKYRVEAVLEDGRSTSKSVRASGQDERKIKLRIG